jgi:hypothetical protein
MTSLERSAALRRMGITEWLPRADGAAVVSVDEASAVQPTPLPQREAVVRVEPVQVAALAKAAVPPVSAPVPTIALAQSSNPVVSVPTSASQVSVPGLRGRLLTAVTEAPLLVLAMAEKSPRDTMLNLDAASGALLKAMLASLSAPACVALLGVERGEPVPVPATILVLGERSARLLLGNDIAAPLRGRVHLFGKARVVVSYHPDELRQNGSLKRLAWDDLRLVASLLTSASSASAGSS